MTSTVPGWMRPPRPAGWHADDLDHLPEAPKHTELVDGTLVFTMFPRRLWHSSLVTALQDALTEQAPADLKLVWGMTIRLDKWNRFEPDLLASTAPYHPD